MSDESKSSPSAALAFVRMAVAGFTFAMVPVLVFEAMRLLGWAEEGGRWELACSLLAFLASGLVLLVLSRALPAGRPLLPVRPFAVLPRYVLFAVPWVGFVVGYLHLMPALGHPLPPQELLLYLAQNGLAAHDSVVVVVVIVIGAPLAEELMFRGWLQQALESLLGARVALWGTAILFGLAHGLDYALPLAFVGLFLGWLRNRHGSLGAPMLAHAVHNGLTAAVVIHWPEILDWMYVR